MIDSEGWLHSGDLAVRDENGYYRITGRIKDMIIRGGENIYPREIEELIYTYPKIQDVQVVGVPSEKYGEEVVAYIILKDGESATEDEIKEFVYSNMSRHKVPSYVRFVDSFPMTASGKIQKYKLREMAKEDILKKKQCGCTVRKNRPAVTGRFFILLYYFIYSKSGFSASARINSTCGNSFESNPINRPTNAISVS